MGKPETCSYPILARQVAGPIAYRQGRAIDSDVFIADVLAFAEKLPNTPYAVNLCNDRYLFMVAFLAVLLRGGCNLLIPVRRLGSIAETLNAYMGACIVHDSELPPTDAAQIKIENGQSAGASPGEIPLVSGDQLAAIVFTSGSAGTSKAIKKSWRTLWLGAQINRKYLFGDSIALNGMAATVPPWHMYGLEWTVLVPLASNTAVYAGDAFFPEDIRGALDCLPAERCLVTTPLHLRALVSSGLDYPATRRILSATAPLELELANRTEQLLSGDLLEIYGCSEAGSVACRRPSVDPAWRFYDEYEVDAMQSRVRLNADHLDETVELADVIDFHSDGGFTLHGRHTDLVKIGGKRASLVELTSRLLAIEGVEDGVIFNPEVSRGTESSRLSALVVSKRLTVDDIGRELAMLVDPVFLPRPLRIVGQLPRSDTGKLQLRDLVNAIDNPQM